MASNSKASLIRRISGATGGGNGANTGMGTRDIIVPELPNLPAKLTDQTVREFRDAMERWRASLQAQFPVPASQSAPAEVDVSAQVGDAISAAMNDINSRVSAFVNQINVKVNQLEQDIINQPPPVTTGLTEAEVRLIILNSRYTHFQGTPASIWTANHNLGWKPVFAVTDASGNVVHGDVKYNGTLTTILSFAGPFSGEAYFS